MLESLEVRQFGVVDHVALAFGEAMTAFTGETGAGKTLLVEALHLVLGGRADLGLIRPGAAEAHVVATFRTEEGARVTLERVVASGGRSKALFNGEVVPVGELRVIGTTLLEIHGQHDAQRLLHPDAARDALDRFGGIDVGPVVEARQQVRMLREALRRLGGDAAQVARDHALAVHELQVLDDADLDDPAEVDALVDEFERLGDAAAAQMALSDARRALSGDDESLGALGLIAAAQRSLSGRAVFAGAAEEIAALAASADDVSRTLARLTDAVEVNPARQDAVAARLQVLRDLLRRYGGDVETLIATRERLRREIADAERLGTDRAAIEAALDDAAARLVDREAALFAQRSAIAPQLASEVTATLGDLQMAAARFEVVVGADDGGDDVTFLFSANAGMRPQELTRVASGGELSRIMLALHLAVPSGPRSLVFDEVDAGVGGIAATALAELLAKVAATAQVFVVTHLPQVAARATAHYAVVKHDDALLVRTDVHLLSPDDREIEIARMLSGSPDSPVAQAHARELLRRM
jgi:DNA repair protein RecN (Recombination protein N)